jgi:hypothetical protein
MSFLELAKVEASPPEVMAQEPKADEEQSTVDRLMEATTLDARLNDAARQDDLGWTVRVRLSWIERSAFAIRVIQEAFQTQKANEIRSITSSSGWDESDPERLERIASYFDALLEPHSAFLLLRGYAVGYDHPSILPAVYATMHGLSYNNLDQLFDVARVLEEECGEHWDHIGIERQKGEPTYWQLCVDSDENITYLPRCWAFAVHMAELESNWRPEQAKYGHYPDEEEEVRLRYSTACEFFGHDRFKAMLGGTDKLPWSGERHHARDLFWQRKALASPEEYQHHLASVT